MTEFERDVIHRLASIEEKQNYFLALEHRLALIENNHPHPDHEQRIRQLEKHEPDGDHETRIRALERKVWIVAGGLAALSWLADRLPAILG